MTKTSPRPKALISWSSGKDSAWALHMARLSGDYDIVSALTTVTDAFGRVSIHGVREELLMAQLAAAGLPATVVRLPYPCSNEIYERAMATAMDEAIRAGVTHVIFGDLFLQDIRDYRVAKLTPLGVTPVFPVWGLPTDKLARDMISDCVEAYIATVDLK
jgi:diphthamide synthase (EF-2-diphthine--ammonia ligase)